MIEEWKKKKCSKKKTKDIKKLRDKNEHAMQMVDGIKDTCDEKVRENDVDLKKTKITVAEAEACTEIVTKENHNKEIECVKYENRINTMKINHNQALINLNNRKMKSLC